MARDDLDSDDSDVDDSDNLENTYLTFGVGGEEFALHVSHVTEIVRLQKIFAVPDVESHIRGVINLRGKVIPLLDVRARFGVPQVAYTDRTVVVVIEVDRVPTGLIVDKVFDIAEFATEGVEHLQSSARGGHRPLVTSVSKRGDRVSFIVDANALVGQSQLAPSDSPPNERVPAA
jgi:purine-binding chemotaxis protein CheW